MGGSSVVPWDPCLRPPPRQLWGRSRYPRGAFLGDNPGHCKTFSPFSFTLPGCTSPLSTHTPSRPDTLSPEQGMLPGLPPSETQDILGVTSGTATPSWQEGG